MTKPNLNKYYNGEKLHSQNKIFSFSIGTRSIGKSFYWKRRIAQHALKNKRQFMYFRRYGKEIDLTAPSFFNDIKHSMNPRNIYDFKGDEFIINDEVVGYAHCFSSIQKLKSVMFDRVDYFLFDEFLPEDGRYKGKKDNPFFEPKQILSLYQSIARGYGESIRPVRFIFLANAVSIINPYFSLLGIDKHLRNNQKFYTDESVAVEIVTSDAIQSEIMNSQFGDILRRSGTVGYVANNEFLLDNYEFVEKHNRKTMKYNCSIVFNGITYGLWLSPDLGIAYLCEFGDCQYPASYSVSLADHAPNQIMLGRATKMLKELRNWFDMGLLRFDSLQTKENSLSWIINSQKTI